jgi:N-acetylmuramoyl-L-alanine amidase
MTWADYYKTMLAVTGWREARSLGREGMLSVMCVIRNRVNAGMGDWDHVITSPRQFSSVTAPGDGQLTKWPDSPNTTFDIAMDLAERVYNGCIEDITGGAIYYFNPRITPASSSFWSTVANNPDMEKTCEIGPHCFYRKRAA